nr:helix-turn-helix domain-containing protein [uncultured Oscillibacter sp.]
MVHTRTIREAAAYFQESDPHTCLTETAIRTLLRTGAVPSARVGRKYLVTIEALEAYLEGSAPPKEVSRPASRKWQIR